MRPYEELMKKNNSHKLFILALLICYIIFNIQTPHFIAPLIDNIYGNIIIIIFAFYIIFKCNAILGIVFLLAAYELIRRSSETTGTAAIKRFLPSQLIKDKHFSAFNQFPVTLEEEMVTKMAPLVTTPGPNHLHYEPSMAYDNNAMDVNDTTSII